MSITSTWKDDYIDHVQELYHSETGNLQHTEADLILYVFSLWSQWSFKSYQKNVYPIQ